jgi:hypothetical protein
MEVVTSENMVDFQWTACHYIPEDRTLLVTINIQKLSCELQFAYSSKQAPYVNGNMTICSVCVAPVLKKLHCTENCTCLC